MRVSLVERITDMYVLTPLVINSSINTICVTAKACFMGSLNLVVEFS